MSSNSTCKCKGCTKRTIGCHATCPDYISFKKEREEILRKKAELNDYEALRFDMGDLRISQGKHNSFQMHYTRGNV